jgi:hypothetical protein
MALVLLASPETANLTPAKKQEYADTLILTSLLIALAGEAAKANGPASVRDFADTIQQSGLTDLGVNLRAIRLTDEGFRL